MKSKALIVKGLTVAYDKNDVLQDIDLEIPAGKLVAIIGPNGAGKTTLIKTVLSLIKPLKGEVHFPTIEGKNQIAYVPQSESVDWDFPTTVLDVVMMGRYGHLGLFKNPTKTDTHISMEMLRKVGLEEYANRHIKKLSGGQQQRVFLARALAQEAKIYFLDEPLKGVDVKTQSVIIDLLKQLKDDGKTIIAVHHELHTVEDYFDWVVMVNRRIIATGETKDVFTKENIFMTM